MATCWHRVFGFLAVSAVAATMAGTWHAAPAKGASQTTDAAKTAQELAYGAYLAGECTTCHRSEAPEPGIPSLAGLPREAIVEAMHAYRAKERENPVMRLIASSLDDAQISALAVYFESLGEE